MLNYYSSVIKDDTEIQNEIIDYYSDKYSEKFIKNILNYLYEINFIKINNTSITGWFMYKFKETIEEINKIIEIQLEKSKLKLLLVKILQNNIEIDIIKNCSQFI